MLRFWKNSPSDTAARRLLLADQAMMCSLVAVTTLLVFALKVYIACRDLTHEIPPPQIWDGALLPSLWRVLSCSAEDFAVGLACLLAGVLLLRLGRATWYRRLILIAAHFAAALAVCYMVINVQVFHVLRRFITYSLFLLAGGLRPEKSVNGAGSLQMRLLLALIPLFALAVHFGLFRYLRPVWQRLAAFLRPVVVIILVLALGAVAFGARKGAFSADKPEDFACNPHWHMARSCIARITFGQVEDAGNIDGSDFEPGQPGDGLRACEASLKGRPRNVILIVLESTCALYMQNYGYAAQTTPQLCALQDKGVVFDNFYSNANQTVASSLTLQASLYNDTNTWNTAKNYPRVQFPCIATWAGKHGLHSYFLGTGGSGVWGCPDESVRFLSHFDLARTGDRYWSEQTRPWPLSNEDYTDSDVFQEAQRCIDEAGHEPFLLMMWNYGTHYPYDDEPSTETFSPGVFPRGAFRNKETVDDFGNYLRAIHNADSRIGNLYRCLEERGLADDTVVIVTGDHGEAWGQHGRYFHGHSLFDEDVHVPLILLCPRLAGLGPRRSTVGSHVDLWPTIADVLGFEPLPQWQGHSLFAPTDDNQRRAYFSRVGIYGSGLGVREGRYKYIFDCDDNAEMLFDMQDDPGELHNLATSEPEYCLELRRRLRDWTLYQPGYLKSLEP